MAEEEQEAVSREYSYELGNYSIQRVALDGVLPSPDKEAMWNDIAEYQSALQEKLESGGKIGTGELGSNLTIRHASGTVTVPTAAWGGGSWNTGFYYDATPALFTTIAGSKVWEWNATYAETQIPIRFPDGTAAAPSITFTSDTGDGIYHDTDEVNVTVAGADAFIFRQAGLTTPHESISPILFPAGNSVSPAVEFPPNGINTNGIYTNNDTIMIFRVNGGDRFYIAPSSGIVQSNLPILGNLNGTAANPTFQVATNNTGMYATTDDSDKAISFTTGGTRRAYIGVLGVTAIQNLRWYSSTAFTRTMDHTNTADRTYYWPDQDVYISGSSGGLLTAGSVMFVGTGGVYAEDNANFFWDDTTKIFKAISGRQYKTERLTANHTLDKGDHRLYCNTDGGAFTVTLDGSPSSGQNYVIFNTGSNNLTIARNGNNINGVAADVVVSPGNSADITYETTEGWWF